MNLSELERARCYVRQRDYHAADRDVECALELAADLGCAPPSCSWRFCSPPPSLRG